MKITYIKPTGHTYDLTVTINAYLETTPDYTSDASDWDTRGDEEIDFDITDCIEVCDLVGIDRDYLEVFTDDDLEDIYKLVLSKYKEEDRINQQIELLSKALEELQK